MTEDWKATLWKTVSALKQAQELAYKYAQDEVEVDGDSISGYALAVDCEDLAHAIASAVEAAEYEHYQ